MGKSLESLRGMGKVVGDNGNLARWLALLARSDENINKMATVRRKNVKLSVTFCCAIN